MYAECSINDSNRESIVRNKMEEFSKAKLVITDRLHAMIFSAITGTPCIALGNYNHKIKGSFEWLKSLNYIRFVENESEAMKCVPEMLKMKDCCFNSESLKEYYESFANVIRKKLM